MPDAWRLVAVLQLVEMQSSVVPVEDLAIGVGFVNRVNAER